MLGTCKEFNKSDGDLFISNIFFRLIVGSGAEIVVVKPLSFAVDVYCIDINRDICNSAWNLINKR